MLKKLFFILILTSFIFTTFQPVSAGTDMNFESMVILIAKTVKLDKEKPTDFKRQKQWDEMTPEERQALIKEMVERIEKNNKRIEKEKEKGE